MIQDQVRGGFVEDAPLTVSLQVQLERLQLNAALVGDIGDVNGAEVGMPRLRTDRGELGTVDIYGELPFRMRVREGLQDVFGESGPDGDLLDKYGISPPHVAAAIRDFVAANK